MNAYVIAWDAVHDEDRDAAVVFCASEEDARRVAFERGGAVYDPADRETVTVRREPRFDEYASAGRVPASAFLAAGWCLPCGYCCCEHTIRDDAEDYSDDYAEGRVVHPDDAVTEDHRVWCSAVCRDADALRRAWCKALTSYVRAALPHATRVSAHARSDGWSVCWSSPEAPHPRSGEYVITSHGEHWRCEDRDEVVYARDVAALRGVAVARENAMPQGECVTSGDVDA